MGRILTSLTEAYQEQLERHRNRPFLRAAMGACALVSMANHVVSLRDRMRVDQLLETLDKLQVYDPHEGVELFNEFVAELRDSEPEGRAHVYQAIDDEVAEEPDKAELLIRICLAVSEEEQGVPAAERECIIDLCRRLGLESDSCYCTLSIA